MVFTLSGCKNSIRGELVDVELSFGENQSAFRKTLSDDKILFVYSNGERWQFDRAESLSGKILAYDFKNNKYIAFHPIDSDLLKKQKWSLAQISSLGNEEIFLSGSSRDITGRQQSVSTDTLIYNFSTGLTKKCGKLLFDRDSYSQTVLPDNEVFIAGGGKRTGKDFGVKLFNNTQVVNLKSCTARSSGSLTRLRAGHHSFLLPNKRIFIVGGEDEYLPLASVELYSVENHKTVYSTTLLKHDISAEFVQLKNGNILIFDNSNPCEIYDWKANKFFLIDTIMRAQRLNPHTLLLQDGKVLVLGGFTREGYTPHQQNSVEIFNPENNTFNIVTNVKIDFQIYDAENLSKNKVLILGKSHTGEALSKVLILENL